jgi:hypothetical protein
VVPGGPQGTLRRRLRPRSPSRGLERERSQSWKHTPPGTAFLKSIKCFREKKRKKKLYKNLFTYKILKKVQVKTQCEGRAQIRSVYMCVCGVCVCVCVCVMGTSARVAHRVRRKLGFCLLPIREGG